MRMEGATMASVMDSAPQYITLLFDNWLLTIHCRGRLYTEHLKKQHLMSPLHLR